MGNKENILEILKENKDGLTIAELDTQYESEYEKKLGHSLYSYLSRLSEEDLIEAFIPKVRERKVIGYRATDKAYEEDRKEEALEKLNKTEEIVKRLLDGKNISEDDYAYINGDN